MIVLQNLALRRDGRVLFSNASLQINAGDKVGLVGNNGTGKSSFFAQLLGKVALDEGLLVVPKHYTIAHMAQHVQSSEQSAHDFVLSGDSEWHALNQKIGAFTSDNAACVNLSSMQSTQSIATDHARFEDIDGWRTPAKALQIMAGLGFSPEDAHRTVQSFSGGWRMRLNLARTLMCPADLLLLDEPTNHLDLDAILWLENHLQKFLGTLMLISHDQAFLDALTDKILHIENQSMQLYSGNYSTFTTTYAQKRAQLESLHEKQEAVRVHLTNYIRRFGAKASGAKQAKSRQKQLQKMQALAPIFVHNAMDFRFYAPKKLAQPLIVLNDVCAGYDDKPVVNHVNINITPESRIAILGANGAGKSTIIKTLVGDILPLSGTRKVADCLSIGYFNQHQMDSIDKNATPFLMIRRLIDKNLPNQDDASIRAFLGSFGFCGDRIDAPATLFSGGELARLLLACIIWQRPNVLVLDEPTNHLDMDVKNTLSLALHDFLGAVVLVSHDRQLIKQVCDELFVVQQGVFSEFSGDMDDYDAYVRTKNMQNIPQNAPKQNESTTPSKLQKRQNAAQKRQKLRPLIDSIQKYEQQLDDLTKNLQQIEQKLCDSALYEDAQKPKLLALLEEQAMLKTDLERIEIQLLDAMSRLEVYEKQLDEADL